MTAIGADVVVLPAASRARAVSVWAPFGTPRVSQLSPYGGDVSSTPDGCPSTRKRTPATPTLSFAVAVTCAISLTLAPLFGAVIATVGGVASTEPVAALNATMCITQADAFCVAVAL